MTGLAFPCSMLIKIHERVFGSRLTTSPEKPGLPQRMMLVSDAPIRKVAILFLELQPLIPADISLYIMHERITASFRSEKISFTDGECADSYYVLNGFELLLWLEEYNLEKLPLFGFGVHLIRREMRAINGKEAPPLRTLENIKSELADDILRENLDQLVHYQIKRHARWLADDFLKYPCEEHIDAFLTSLLVKQYVSRFTYGLVSNEEQARIIDRIAKIVKT